MCYFYKRLNELTHCNEKPHETRTVSDFIVERSLSY